MSIHKEEEKIYTNPNLIYLIREKLLKFFSNIASNCIEPKAIEKCLNRLKDSRDRIKSSGWRPRRIGVVDGGSTIIALNSGYIGIAAAIGIVIDGDRVVDRVVAEPIIVPEDVDKLSLFPTQLDIDSVIDKLRESLVFETSANLLDKGIDMIVIDGPLAPYSALGRIVAFEDIERSALERYRDAVLRFHKMSYEYDIDVVGFVKRPRSRYLRRMYSECSIDVFDHVLLAMLLSDGEYFPSIPREIIPEPDIIRRHEIRDIVDIIKPRFIYTRFSSSMPPYRVEFGQLENDFRDILGYLYSSRTREGIPYIVMKVDEEVKMSRKLIRDLYDDVRHEYIVKFSGRGYNALIPILPEFGELGG
ncbi:NurA domain [Ignisphaera aggregans DSM 17230]|uniref:NurA domain n=1 Tax=Ignisphaera aggregans (strain DSM 17230 / JCM 13409 / AQ1.S1) TaxID=583356 RepID=E0STV2_IGNAA|nr:NurA domain [Ignisphaera aggregans DSM 17230]